MINGIKPNIKSSTLNEVDKTKLGIPFNEGIDRLLAEIQVNYNKWGASSGIDKTLDLKIKTGRKFVKIIEGNRVWGFISRVDGVHKGLPMKTGDVFKAASWNAAAKHARGNIFDDNEVISLLKLNIPVYNPDSLPEDLKKIEPVKPGSRKD